MLNNKEEITKWLKKMKITNYLIQDNMTVDVHANVELRCKELKEIPIQFYMVIGSFNCSENKLTTLKGSPKIVGGSFNCSSNQLTSLEYAPDKILNGLWCVNNPIENFFYEKLHIGGILRCSHTEKQPGLEQYYNTEGNLEIPFKILKKHFLAKKLENELEIVNTQFKKMKI